MDLVLKFRIPRLGSVGSRRLRIYGVTVRPALLLELGNTVLEILNFMLKGKKIESLAIMEGMVVKDVTQKIMQ